MDNERRIIISILAVGQKESEREREREKETYRVGTREWKSNAKARSDVGMARRWASSQYAMRKKFFLF